MTVGRELMDPGSAMNVVMIFHTSSGDVRNVRLMLALAAGIIDCSCV
jgi:hypothetical protein